MIFVIRGPMRRLVGFKQRLQVDAPTVNDGLSELCVEYPDLRRALFDASGQLRRVHRLALNHTLLSPGQLDTPVAVGDELEVLTPLAGG
jgi:molybdopterin converting factor small subunit